MSTPSIAHKLGMNSIGKKHWPDGLVSWREASPPETEGYSRCGHLRACGYCGSMHPSDVANAIQNGAKGEWSDWKYGWPHKAYFDGIPNPHAGLMEVRASANHKPDYYPDWIQCGDHWHEPPRPASEKTNGKFYSVHLMDATPEERQIIETHLGLSFYFSDDGSVSWKRV